MVNHNSSFKTIHKTAKKAVKGPKINRKYNKGSIRDIMSEEHVNSFVFPEINSLTHKPGDASRMTGLTMGTNEDIPSAVNDQTIEYYS